MYTGMIRYYSLLKCSGNHVERDEDDILDLSSKYRSSYSIALGCVYILCMLTFNINCSRISGQTFPIHNSYSYCVYFYFYLKPSFSPIFLIFISKGNKQTITRTTIYY